MTDRRVTGIGGVFLRARDRVGLASWYERHLGIPVEQSTYAVFRWRDSEDPSRPGSTVWAMFDADSDYFGRPDQQAMLNYRVADIDAVLTTLRSEGVDVDARVDETPDGRFGWIRDPEGNRIELWQPPAGR